MYNKAKTILVNNKKIFENFSFLSLFQIFTLVSPLITYPYLIKVVGLELYGTVVFVQTVISYLSLLINFGYNTLGPKEVSILKNQPKELSEFVSSVFIVKSVLWFITFVLFLIIILSVPYFQSYFLLYLFTFFITIGDVLFPIWFFQGVEKMKYITYINILVKTLFIVGVFIFVRTKNDYILIPVINAIGALVSGLISVYLVLKRENVTFTRVRFVDMKKSFRESFVLFISSISISIYLGLNKLIVGTFLGMRDVAIYDLAEKVISIIKTPILMFSQAIFPKIAREKTISFINKSMLVTLFGVFVLYIFLFVFANQIVLFFIHSHNAKAVDIIRLYGLSMFFLGINMFLGGLRLIPFGYNKQFMYVMMANGVFYFFVISILYLFNNITLYTITIAYVLTELFCSLYLMFTNKKLKLL